MKKVSKLDLNIITENLYIESIVNDIFNSIKNHGEIKVVLNESFSDIKKIISDTLNELGLSVKFVTTFGTGIGAFIGPVTSLLSGSGFNLSKNDVVLLIITAISFLINDTNFDKLKDELTFRGLHIHLKSVINFINKSKDIIGNILNKVTGLTYGLVDILSFTFILQPTMDVINKLTHDYGLNMSTVEKWLTGVGLGIIGYSVKSTIGLIKNKLDNKKKLKESFEDFEWAKEITPWVPGKLFNDDDVCFDSDDCEVNINKDEIVFKIDYSTWSDLADISEDDNRFLSEFFRSGSNYDGNGDYHEFDSDEFNYSSHYFTDEQKSRLKKIINITSPNTDIDSFFGPSSDEMLEINKLLKYRPLNNSFDTLVWDYLSHIGYAIQENRWLSLGREFENRINETRSEWEYDYTRWGAEEITIKVPLDVVYDWYNMGVNDLSTLLYKVSTPIGDVNWYDWFYEEWDTSGAEDKINDSINTFLDEAEEFLEDSDEVSEYKKYYDLIEKLGFKNTARYYYGGNIKSFYLNNPDNTFWILEDRGSPYRLYLKQYEGDNKTTNMWNAKPIRSAEIDIEELPQYINNYTLKL